MTDKRKSTALVLPDSIIIRTDADGAILYVEAPSGEQIGGVQSVQINSAVNNLQTATITLAARIEPDV